MAFIYCLLDPRNNEPRYIGKTNNLRRRFNSHIISKDKSYRTNWIQHLIKNNLKPSIEIIDEVDDNECKFWEKHYISLYKSWGFNLVNGTIGGDGDGGKKEPHSEERKKNISLSLIGNITWNKGKTKIYSDDTIKKMSESRIGNPGYWEGKTGYFKGKQNRYSDDTIKKMSDKSKERLRDNKGHFIKNNNN